ncbi:hypothetical protein PBI_BEAGLE_122 [Arthrobacter phage Beagle]|nr:hypothetical protein PBI_BEAGLE_122 [Arthrobacter phage Beagle]QOP66865.1 hypothetical protein SEA_ODYSSEY395_116 [Arthrobacter phage Odyssey395]
MAPTESEIALSHTIDDYERRIGPGLRSARMVDSVIADLRHAIEHGRTDAALHLLASLDRSNQRVIEALKAPSRTI